MFIYRKQHGCTDLAPKWYLLVLNFTSNSSLGLFFEKCLVYNYFTIIIVIGHISIRTSLKNFKMTKVNNMAFCLQPGLHLSFGIYSLEISLSFHCLKEQGTQQQSSSQQGAAAMNAILVACVSSLFANCVFIEFVGRSLPQ